MEFTGAIIFFIGLLVGYFATRIIRPKDKQIEGESNADTEQLRNRNIGLEKDVEHLNNRIEKSIEEFNKQKERENLLQEEKSELKAQLSSTETNLLNLEEKLSLQKEELEKMQEKFTKEFKLVANEVLKQNSQEFSKAHQKELDSILNPLKENIKSFETKVEERYVKSRDEQLSLKHQIKSLTELNNALNEQAQNLTDALKGENKTQGNWGELVLERILESSGLIKGEEYETQFSDTNADQKRIQPDVIIKLPDDKHIIVDSKVSLVAYERLVNAEDQTERENHIKSHLISIKSHIKQLSEKNYQSGIGLNSPDFVLLFIPIEPSFTVAAQYDPELFTYAWDKKVVIVSPTTLLATLRTIASVWKHERQTKNAIEIADRAGRLYDKFKSFVDDMQKIEKGLSTAQNAYDDAFNKLSSGKGNLVNRAENIKELGAKATKSLPKELLEDVDEKD